MGPKENWRTSYTTIRGTRADCYLMLFDRIAAPGLPQPSPYSLWQGADRKKDMRFERFDVWFKMQTEGANSNSFPSLRDTTQTSNRQTSEERKLSGASRRRSRGTDS